MQNCGVMQSGLKLQGAPIVGRFVTKLIVDVLPAALASLIGGFLFTQYQSARPAVEHPVAVQVAPASTEMMQLLRDEHSAILDYLKTERTAENNRIAADAQDDARAVADAKADAKAAADAKAQILAQAQIAADAKAVADARALAAAAVRRIALAAKAAAPHPKTPAIAVAQASPATTHEPLVIAQADLAAPADATTARDPNSLMARTIDLKDHVVAATRNVVSAIGDIPTWIAGRIGNSNAPPAPRQLSAAS